MPSALLGPFSRVCDALAWRIRRVVGDARVDRSIVSIAKKWRLFLKKPAFIGIAGSAGKTTTKELLVGILSYRQEGIGTLLSLNALPEVAKVILRVRRRHDYCVAEISEDRPGAMDPVLTLLQPSIGIVTVIKDDHLAAFTSREALTAEMGKLVAALPAIGTAILNADDENVLALRAVCKARVITYGMSSNADLRAEEISSVWPDRLQLTAVRDAERVRVMTQLCGTHWVPSVLGAIGGGLASGMTLQECATAIAKVAPFEARMQPVTTPEGVTFIRDDFKAPLWTLDACFQFMRDATAKRKIIVIGELSDTGSEKARKYARLAAISQDAADITIFVGPWSSSVLRSRKQGREGALHAFGRVHDAAVFLKSITREGDLVLLKGIAKQDHLLRIIMMRSGEIRCWRDDCQRNIFCDECPDRMRPAGVALPETPANIEGAPHPSLAGQITLDSHEQVVVGLGNPGTQFVNTPHNIGYEVVDQLAARLDIAWTQTPHAWIARGSFHGIRICLLKIQKPMNLIGPALKQLATDMAFRPEQCILVFDDLDLPLGTVKIREKGSAGGHLGAASILEAFQTDGFGRVKVGVAQHPPEAIKKAEYVLTNFPVNYTLAIDTAVATACTRVLEIVKTRRSQISAVKAI